MPDAGMSAIAAPIIGSVVGGLLSGSGSQQNGSATTTQASQPWGPSQPYLNQIQQSAQNNYNNASYTPAMGDAQSTYLNQLNNANPQLQANINNVANNAMTGAYDTHLGAIASVDPTNALNSLGSNNPIQANNQLLSGQINNPYLQQMQQASTNQAMQTYNQGLQNAMQTIEPQIQSGAIGAGQYGGSRQGIAEGIMGQQQLINAANLGQSSLANGANLYGNAYSQAQNLMGSAANNLTNLGVQNGQFNANLGLNNNTQQMQQQQYNLGNAMQGINAAGAANTFAANTFAGQMNALNSPNSFATGQLSNYANLVNPIARMGTSQTNTAPIYDNPLGGALSGGMLGLGAYSAYNKANPSNPYAGNAYGTNLTSGNSGMGD